MESSKMIEHASLADPPDTPEPTPSHLGSRLSRTTAFLFALACGLAVANVYYAQPLLDAMAADFGISHAVVGLVITVTQAGYGVGLLLLVPLGDLVNRRRLVLAQLLLCALALMLVALAKSSAIMLAGMFAVGLLAVAAQTLVAYAADLTSAEQRGRVVGIVTGGIILGILLARSVSGLLADVFGWRSVYIASASATVIIVALLALRLPRDEAPRASMPYLRLIFSLFTLVAQEPMLRNRAVLALLIFAALTCLWTPMVLPLSAPPLSLSLTEVGLFGIAGAMGVVGAAGAGRLADRGHADRVTGIALATMLASWMPLALLPYSLPAFAIGVLALDFGLQAAHVTNQSLIFRLRAEARSRLVAAYMIFYSIGSAVGSILSTTTYALAGWPGVCVLGSTISAAALVFWVLTRRSAARRDCAAPA